MPSNAARPEGERWFEWPLTPTSIGMTAAELISELYENISALNRDRSWNLTLVAPARFGDIIIDREAGCLRAKCAWKTKDPSQLGPAPAGREGRVTPWPSERPSSPSSATSLRIRN